MVIRSVFHTRSRTLVHLLRIPTPAAMRLIQTNQKREQ